MALTTVKAMTKGNEPILPPPTFSQSDPPPPQHLFVSQLEVASEEIWMTNVECEIDVYFGVLDKLYYMKTTQMLELLE